MKVVASKKLKNFLELYTDRRVIADKLGTDETVISRILKGERTFSASLIAHTISFTGLPYEVLFDEVDD